MYSSREYNAYGQQQQPKFGQIPEPDGGSQLSMASRHSALLSGANYGGQYASVYGSTAHTSALQAPASSTKGAGSSLLESRYGSTMQDAPKYTSDVRLPYGERDFQNVSTARFADSVAFGHHQTDIYDRIDTAAAAVRQELLQSRSLQPVSVDRSSRQTDYLAARAAAIRHLGQEILPYGGRIDANLPTLSMISGTQHAPSILGPASRREVEDLVYTHSSVNPGYGVSLQPGRDYVLGKSLHGTSLESAYLDGVLARLGYSRLDDLKDGMAYAREIERREEDRRREIFQERERDHDRDQDRERERERRRERERVLERQDTERKREIRRSRSPRRISRDRVRSTSAARGRSSRRKSLRRRRSPVKEKRREYVCKVYSSNLVHTERDYLSMDKQYSRLFVSPECSKVIVSWSKEDLNIPLNTPISFEHDFVQGETPSEQESASIKTVTNGQTNLESGTTTRWNAKMLLMSGLSRNAWEELLSERKYDDRIPHLCNMLRFAFLKNGNSLMAIGGSWDTVDGNDPSVNKSTLIQTVSRHAKELTGLDLKNCRNWNPFLEIHYDRIGKDGLFSHKEITVLYIPDLTDCLPSIDTWRDQWLAHKKAVAERERLHALKREKSREGKQVSKVKEPKTETYMKNVEKLGKKKESGSAKKVNGKGNVGTPVKADKAGKEGDKIVTEKKDKDKTITKKKDDAGMVVEGNNSEKKKDNALGDQTTGSGKKGRKDKKKVDEPPRHLGLILQTKGDKNSKLRSFSLSLDSLLDYTDKDIEESTFELSLFAETFYEMLQYQMGSRILAFLQKLRIKYVAKRNRKKRRREETSDKKEKGKTKKPSAKHQKTDDTVESKSVKTETLQEDEKYMVIDNEDNMKIDNEDNMKKEDESAKDGSKEEPEDLLEEPEEDPEEEPEEELEEPKEDPKGEPEYLEEEPEEDPEEEPEEELEEPKEDPKGEPEYLEEPEEDPEEEPEEDPEEEPEEDPEEELEEDPEEEPEEDSEEEPEEDPEEEPEELEEAKEDPKRELEDLEDEPEEDPEEEPEEDPEEEPEEDPEEEPEEDPKEEPEEDPEEDEVMADADNEEKAEVDRVDMNSGKKDENVTVNLEKIENSKLDTNKKKKTLHAVDKELLQAFRFFDRNRVGYIRVEDLRLILHSLGKCTSHRDVKELVQSALLESNTGRDDQILYKKLVKMTDI